MKKVKQGSLFLHLLCMIALIIIIHLSILCLINKEHFEDKPIPIVWDLSELSNNNSCKKEQKKIYIETKPQQKEHQQDQSQDQSIDMASELMRVMDNESIYKIEKDTVPSNNNLETYHHPNNLESNLEIDKFFKQTAQLPKFTPPKEWGKSQNTVMEGEKTSQSSSNRVNGINEKVINGGNFLNGLQAYDNLETNFDFLPKT